MRFTYLLLLCLFASLLSAQGSDEPDPIDPLYVDIFRAYKNKLDAHGYPVGRAGNAAYIPDQYVLKYAGPTAEADFRADLRKIKRAFGAGNVEVLGECGCSDQFRIYTISVKNLGGEERGKKGGDRLSNSIGREEVTPNYYLVPELEQVEDHPSFNNLPPNFTVIPSGKPAAPVDIAVLDTGLDPYFQHPQVTNGRAPLYLWENPDPNDPDDPFCKDDDLFGWDFVNDDNAPLDDHSHGTHVASRIAHQLETNAPDVNYRFMSVKMLDHDGVGNSFTAACAVYYAAANGAHVINASWGFYGESDPVLREAFEYARSQGVATMTSAGNFRRDLNETRHYPSGFALGNNPNQSIFFASASRTGSQLWPLTNFRAGGLNSSAHFVAAPGANLLGFIPRHFGAVNNVGRKSGTSVSTPFASALAAHYHHLHPGADPVTLRNTLLAEISAQGRGEGRRYRGATLPAYVVNR
ncbi:MAG: S8 family serine peptidase, partial [Bacteroidota bacterium]